MCIFQHFSACLVRKSMPGHVKDICLRIMAFKDTQKKVRFMYGYREYGNEIMGDLHWQSGVDQ